MNVLDEIVLNTRSKLEVMKSKTSLEELISQVTKLKIKKICQVAKISYTVLFVARASTK